MTLEDIKFLLIFTRKVFGVKSEVKIKNEKPFDKEGLRKLLLAHRKWQQALTGLVILVLIGLTGIGIYGFIVHANIIDWFVKWWYFIPIFFVILLIGIIGTAISKAKIRETVNSIPTDQFDNVLRLLNDFEVFGNK